MCNKNDYKPFAFAIKLIILENFLITLPAVVCSLIFKDLVVFQKNHYYRKYCTYCFGFNILSYRIDILYP